MNIKTFVSLIPFAAFLSHALGGEVKKPEPTTSGTSEVEKREMKVGPVSVSVSTSIQNTSKGLNPVVSVTADSISISRSGESVAPNDGKKLAAYLGVVAVPASEAIRAQLDLPEGMGLVVEALAEDGPAKKAGVQLYDVLTKFNDQLLTSPEHLAALVKSAGKGAAVQLTLVRKGAEQRVPITLEERLDAGKSTAVSNITIGGTGTIEVEEAGGSKINIQIPDLGEYLKKITGGFSQSGTLGKSGQDKLEKKKANVSVEKGQAEAFEQVREATRATQEAEKKGGGAQVFSFFKTQMQTKTAVWSDGKAEIKILEENGKRSIKISEGAKEVYAGPLMDGQDRSAVPEKYRAKLEEAEKALK